MIVDTTMELPQYHKILSMKLFKVIENIGINEEIRQRMTEEATLSEILHTITFQSDSSVYICGSRYEGTTTKGMESDIDFVYIVKNLPVMLNYGEGNGETDLLLIQDDTTPPGYAKLQLMKHGRPLFSNDSIDEIDADSYLEHKSTLTIFADRGERLVYSFQPDTNVFSEFTRHGPSMSRPGTSTRNGSDWVMTLESSTLPECTDGWFSRERNFGWPSLNTLEKCKTMGCLLVPVGHPQSDERHLQWRLSLTKQERQLVSEFSSTQIKCYIVLKFIKKDIICKLVKQDSLTSYHLKTCMFYMMENTHVHFWVPENLTCCVISCIRLIQEWIDKGVCPNFFIPEENMFEGKIEGDLKNELSKTLQVLLDGDCKYLLQIASDELGDRLYRSLLGQPEINTDKHVLIRNESVRLCLEILKLITSGRNLILREQRGFILTGLFETIVTLRETKSITDHSMVDSQRCKSIVLPYLELCFISKIILLAKEKGASDREIWRLLSSNKWNMLSTESDGISVRLKQASIMCTLGYHEESIHILSQLKNDDRFSVCSCERLENVYPDIDNLLANITETGQVTAEHLLQKFVVPCVVFLPGEDTGIPEAIRYEMGRSKDMAENSRNYEDHFWYDWAIVDGLFLQHFLLYSNHASLGKTSEVANDIRNMERIIETKDVSHRETCWNLLGWVYKQQLHTDKAMDCFKNSLSVKPLHNAALLHMNDTENKHERFKEICGN